MTDEMIVPVVPFLKLQVDSMERKIKELELEANWLADKGSVFGCPTKDIAKVCTVTNCTKEERIKCWRHTAKKETFKEAVLG